MKNLLSLLMLLGALMSPLVYASASSDPGDDAIEQIILSEVFRDEITRAPDQITDATFYYYMRLVELIFNKNVGRVSIMIRNAEGKLIVSKSVNTGATSAEYYSVPMNPGVYSITIRGSQYEAEGTYTVPATPPTF